MVQGAFIGITLSLACVLPKQVVLAISSIMIACTLPILISDWKNGDYDLVVADIIQMTAAFSTLFMKCFTGDTLVATKEGDKPIEEIAVGDYVWAEDTVTGEQVLKKVLKVYVKETDHLIHIGTSTGEDIETTENHPFYTEERGWVAASELEEGETLHTEDGDIVTVTYNHDEWLKAPIKVYNLEVEGLHTYYVTANRVLVHNQYGNDSKVSQQSDLRKQTNEQLQKSKSSLERLIDEHIHKLLDYQRDPYAHDNKGILENAPSDEIREKIIQGRIDQLIKQINKQKGELEKVLEILDERGW